MNYDINELFSIIQEVNFLWLIPAILMIFVYIHYEGLAMRQIFKTMEIQTTRRANFMYSAIDYYFCAVTPSASGGQPMVAYYMAKDGISLSAVSLTLLINTALFKIVLIILSLVSIIFCSSLVFEFPIMIALFVIGIVINLFIISLC
ncbi:MAG: flippase-like domain-containing protein, partial [Anaeroplasmataceae bacterium]|nr:flippase-like domain-containing protein [Anaeroplasmataceae bacterium]